MYEHTSCIQVATGGCQARCIYGQGYGGSRKGVQVSECRDTATKHTEGPVRGASQRCQSEVFGHVQVTGIYRPSEPPWGVEYAEYAACQKLKSAYLDNRLRITTQTCGWYLKCSRHGIKCRITVLHALLAGWNFVVIIVPPHAVHWAV